MSGMTALGKRMGAGAPKPFWRRHRGRSYFKKGKRPHFLLKEGGCINITAGQAMPAFSFDSLIPQ